MPRGPVEEKPLKGTESQAFEPRNAIKQADEGLGAKRIGVACFYRSRVRPPGRRGADARGPAISVPGWLPYLGAPEVAFTPN